MSDNIDTLSLFPSPFSFSFSTYYYFRLRDALFSCSDDVVGLEKDKQQLMTVSYTINGTTSIYNTFCYTVGYVREKERNHGS